MINDIIEANENVKCNSKPMEILHRNFPQCFNAEGAFDMAVFQKLISGEVNVVHEGYNLDFLGKGYGKLLASVDTTTVIKPDTEHNSRPENAQSENIYISGDNLDALKHLLKSYAGKVKCIYIDPPYNTGSDGFVYNDKFSFTAEELEDRLSIDEDQAVKILDMTSRGSASHSAWLTFMAPRLQLARDLLTDDGVIFISIDNNEFANLKLLCDSIFGEENFVEMFSWVKTATPPALSDKSRKTNEYVLCYERIKNNYKYKGDLLDGGDQPLLNSGNSSKVLTFPKQKLRFTDKKMWHQHRSGLKDRVELLNDINVVDGYSDVDVQLRGEFKWIPETFQQEIEQGTEFIIKSDAFSVRFIRQGEGWKRPTNFIKEKILTPIINKPDQGVGTNESASSYLEELMGKAVFSFPKPCSLIKYLINFVAEDGDIVLDFFSGSATTAESVMQYNSETRKGLKFIMVQLPEDLTESLKNATPISKPVIKNSIGLLEECGYPLTLDWVGIERIKRAALKLSKEKPQIKMDTGFKHYILEEQPENTLDKLESFDKNVTVTDDGILSLFGRETVLETWLVRDGYGFGANVQPVKLDKYTAYLMDKHLYLIDVDFAVDDMVALMDKYNGEPGFNPENIVVFGYSFTFVQMELLQKNLITLSDGVKNKKVNIDVRY